MVETMKMMFLVAFLLLHAGSIEGFEFRLLTTNSQGTEGFVEIFYNDLWGLIGHPEFRFSDVTASLLCEKFNLSASDTYQENNTFSYFWLQKLECNGNERSIDECVKTDDFRRTQFIKDAGTSLQDYGSKLYCVDYRLIGGLSPNTGMLLAAFSDTEHSMCYQGFDSSAGDVVCKHLRYNGLVGFTDGDPGLIPLFNNKLTCTGNESSLNECTMSNAVIENCTRAVYITCKAVRLTTWNGGYNDEGFVEIFYKGSWELVGGNEYAYYESGFNDETAKLLCETFGFRFCEIRENKFYIRNVGFSSENFLLGKEYLTKNAWWGFLWCNGTEADIMQCVEPSHFGFEEYNWSQFGLVPWLYCFDFKITSMRLVNGPNPNEGNVQLLIGGRWGSILMKDENNSSELKTVGSFVCQFLGYVGDSKILDSFVTDYLKHTWMPNYYCYRNKIEYVDCFFKTSGIRDSYLTAKCEDTDQCQSNPCLNNGTCVDGDRSYTCNCTEKWSGINCEIDTDQCQSNPCLNNGTCVDDDRSYTCNCTERWSGINCEIEIREDQTTLIVVLISSICVLSFVVLATVCCCLRYRREHKKNKTDASNVLNSDGKGGSQNTKGVEAEQREMEEGQYNEDAYDEIKENTVADDADYIHPVTDVELPRDANGYVKFADNDKSVGYYKLQHAKTEDYSKLCVYKF